MRALIWSLSLRPPRIVCIHHYIYTSDAGGGDGASLLNSKSARSLSPPVGVPRSVPSVPENVPPSSELIIITLISGSYRGLFKIEKKGKEERKKVLTDLGTTSPFLLFLIVVSVQLEWI